MMGLGSMLARAAGLSVGNGETDLSGGEGTKGKGFCQ